MILQDGGKLAFSKIDGAQRLCFWGLMSDMTGSKAIF